MRHQYAMIALLSFSSLSVAATFAERVAIAKEIESQKKHQTISLEPFFLPLAPQWVGS
jgi:hypothetical protein